PPLLLLDFVITFLRLLSFPSAEPLLLFFYHLFFKAPASTEPYTLSLHDALPISNSAIVFSGILPADSEVLTRGWILCHAFRLIDASRSSSIVHCAQSIARPKMIQQRM